VPRFPYPCPGCRTTSNLHDADCRFDGTTRREVEQAYTDLLVLLTAAPHDLSDLRDRVPGEWDDLHKAALSALKGQQRVVEQDDGDALVLLSAEEYKEQVTEPAFEPLRTIYQKGSVHGAHDNSVFAMVAYYEMIGLSWAETRERVVHWLRESGTWARGGFEEESPEELVDSKRHVYEAGYGWKEKAQAAKAVIDRNV
jgi:hypothetical protein